MKSFKIIGFAVITAVMLFAFVSCGNNVGETPAPTETTTPTTTDPSHTHTFATEWTSDATHHWHAATCEHTTEVSGKAEHTFGEWSTSGANGNKTRKCTACEYEEGMPNLDKLGAYRVLADNELAVYGIAEDSVPPKIAGATYVTFGTWPQTLKKEGVTIDNAESITQGMYTYYRGDDGWWYCLCKENAYFSDYKYSDGKTEVKMLSANSTKWFRVEPIVWRVVTDDYSGKSLLVAEKALTASVPFYGTMFSTLRNRTLTVNGEVKTIYPNNWKYSNVRAWLNGVKNQFESDGGTPTTDDIDWTDKGFLQTAFTENQKTRIVKTTVKNDLDSTGDTTNGNKYVCEDTLDSVFLLSVKEMQTSDWGFNGGLFMNDNIRKRYPTDFALANYASLSVDAGSWWLRSPFYSLGTGVHAVDGFVCDVVNTNYGVNIESTGIVPALCVTK